MYIRIIKEPKNDESINKDIHVLNLASFISIPANMCMSFVQFIT